MIVFDITNKDSFLHIQDWIDEISTYTGTNISKLVLGNKADLDDKREVTKEEIKQFEEKSGVKVVEVSAKTGTAVDNAFRIIVDNLIQRK